MIYKRYQNRKIYNNISHKYVNVGEVLATFKLDKSTRVINYQGVDVTSKVIIEALKKSDLSIDVLYNLSNV